MGCAAAARAQWRRRFCAAQMWLRGLWCGEGLRWDRSLVWHMAEGSEDRDHIEHTAPLAG
jgi:hypothetical protein